MQGDASFYHHFGRGTQVIASWIHIFYFVMVVEP